MIHQSYYRMLSSTPCNEEFKDRYLVVNCTGTCALSYTFATRGIREDYYLLYLCKGSLNVQIDGEMHTMREGQIIIFSPKQEYIYTKSDDREMFYYWVHFSGFGALEFLLASRLLDKGIIHVGINGYVIHEFMSMFDDFIRHDYFFEMSATAHLISICAELGRSSSGTLEKQKSSNQERVLTSLQYIHANYNTDVKIEYLANMEILSVSHYRTIFKQCLGLSPQAYILDLRIKNARDLIMRTNLTLKEISSLVGYHDQFYFSRVFKSHTGIIPSQYKNR